jgi:hypothetical protein
VVTSSADQTSRHASTSRFHLTQSQWGCAMLGDPHDLNEGVITTSSADDGIPPAAIDQTIAVVDEPEGSVSSVHPQSRMRRCPSPQD